jgi:hypothetical protein
MTTRMTIQCPNCGQPNQAMVENLIDVGQNPALKNALLSGQLNSVRCASCGVVSTVAAPLLYHDPQHELLISFVPMELGLPREQQDRVIGDLLKELTARLPQGAFKGYMFQPREALTMQGLVEQLLQADGVTPEAMAAQREVVRLIEQLMQAGPNQTDWLIQENDAKIDGQFFQTALAMMQRAAQEGQEQVVNALMYIQEQAAQLSTYGQEMIALAEQQEAMVRRVAGEIEALGDDPQRSDVIRMALDNADDDEYLQALVGLIRPAMDYQFFQELTTQIGKAPASARQKLEMLRQRLVQLTQMIDQQAQMAMQNADQVLQQVLDSPDPAAALRENVHLIDDAFMAVLASRLQEAERQADVLASGRLRAVYEQTVALLQANMQPELRFMNTLLSTESDEEALALLPEGIEQFGEPLLDMMDSVGNLLAQRGQQDLVEKIAFLREAAARHL